MTKIRVLAKDIKLGIRGSRTNCPIALAIKRVWPNSNLEVGRVALERLVSFENDEDIYIPIAKLPDVAISFIDHFDRGCPRDPFDFVIPIQRSIAEGRNGDRG